MSMYVRGRDIGHGGLGEEEEEMATAMQEMVPSDDGHSSQDGPYQLAVICCDSPTTIALADESLTAMKSL